MMVFMTLVALFLAFMLYVAHRALMNAAEQIVMLREKTQVLQEQLEGLRGSYHRLREKRAEQKR